MAKDTIKWTISVLLFLSFTSLNAQQFITLKGIITNAENGDAVNAAGIYIKKGGLGTVSNELGEFTFFIPEELNPDTVFIAAMGYKNYHIVLKTNKDRESLRIKLKPAPHVLDQVIVKSKNKRGFTQKLIRRAIDSMKVNYSMEPFQIGGYYRDYLEKNHKYFNLFEAALEVEDKGFLADDIKTSRIRLLQMRYNPRYRYDSTQIMLYDNKKLKFIPGAYISPMDGNEFLILRCHDAIRNNKAFTMSFLDYFSRNFVSNHDFKIDSITYLNDTQVYSISFEYNNRFGYDSTDNFSAKGYLVLRKDNLAISKIVYNTYIFNKDYDGKLYNLEVEYREQDGKYYPQYLSFGNYFKIRNRVDTSTFEMKQTVFRKSAKILDVYFNRAVDSISGSDTTNFSIRYGKLKIPIEKVQVMKNVIRLFLKMDKDLQKEISGAYDLVFTIGELADASGNRMAGKYIGYYQHREFFINKINSSVKDEFPYSQIIPKTMPLYWNNIKTDPAFWDTYNFAQDKKLE